MTNTYPHIIPDVGEWPVALQSKQRSEFIGKLNQYVMHQILETHGNNLYDLISRTIYTENQRIKLTPWKVDPTDEKDYWMSIASALS